MDGAWAQASEIAAAVSEGRISAAAVVGAALARIRQLNSKLNAFTDVLGERALERAQAIDRTRAKGPLAGVPFAVKNLFDIAGLATRAGSRINRDRAPATRDATLDTGAVVVVRSFRPQADLRPALARRHVSLRGKPRSCRADGTLCARPCARL